MPWNDEPINHAGLPRADIVLGLTIFFGVLAAGIAFVDGIDGELRVQLLCGLSAVVILLATFSRLGHRPSVLEENAPLERLSRSSPMRLVAPPPQTPIARPGEVRLLVTPWVVDGDTVHDKHTGARYRLANIDAPETGEGAKCEGERRQGERAKWETVILVRKARHVEAHATGQIDQYGRVIANVLVDGRDLGDILIERGLAHPWSGLRERWCGPNGSLIKMAREQNLNWKCDFCNLQNHRSRA